MDSARDEEGARAIVSRATSPRAGRADRSCVLNMITPRRTVAFPPVRPPRQFRAAGQFGFACVSCPLARSDERESAPLLAPVSPGERLVGGNLRRIVPVPAIVPRVGSRKIDYPSDEPREIKQHPVAGSSNRGISSACSVVTDGQGEQLALEGEGSST